MLMESSGAGMVGEAYEEAIEGARRTRLNMGSMFDWFSKIDEPRLSIGNVSEFDFVSQLGSPAKAFFKLF